MKLISLATRNNCICKLSFKFQDFKEIFLKIVIFFVANF